MLVDAPANAILTQKELTYLAAISYGRTRTRASSKKGKKAASSSNAASSSQVNDGTSKELPSSASPTKTSSPKRKVITQIKVSSSKQLFKPRYLLYILDLLGYVRLIFAEREGQPGSDAFLYPVHKAIGEETNPLREHGLIMVSHRHISQENNMARTNSNNNYPRKFIVGTYDEMTSGRENRFVAVNAVRDIMMHSENNKFGHEYIVDERASDLTPANGQLEAVDNYLLDSAIVHFIHAIYEDVSPAWYSQNQELALEYFTPPNFPTVAVTGLGYPLAFNAGGENDCEGDAEQEDDVNEEETTNN